MPVKRKTINLSVSGNALTATDAQTGIPTTDAGVQGEDGAVWFHAAVPSDWQDLSVRLQVLALSGSFDESDLAAGGVIDMPLRQALTVPGRLSVRLVGSDTGGVRRTADCVTLLIAPSAVAADPVPHLYPYPIHRITGSGGALVTQTDNSTWNVNVTGTGGDMLQENYASGSGQGNANTVDHALYADAAASSANATNASSAASGSALETQIAAKASLDSPALTGTPTVNGIREWGTSFANQADTSWQNLGNAISSLSGGGMVMVMGFNINGGAQCFFLLRVMIGSATVIASADNTGCGVSFQMSGLQPQIKTTSGTIQYAVKEWII